MSRADFIAKRASAKRQAILTAARARFAAEGFDRASVEAIAKEAAVSTATLYRLFASKAALFDAVLRNGLEDFERVLADTAGETPLARLEALALAYARLLDSPDTAGVIRALLAAAPATPALADAFYEGVKGRLAGAIHAAVADVPAFAGKGSVPGNLIMGMIEHQTIWRRLLSGAEGERRLEDIAGEAVVAAQRAFE